VTAVTEPRERTLSEVRDRVVSAWKEEQREKTLEENAAALQRELDGRDFVTVAGELFLPLRTAAGLTRVTTPSGDLSSAALAAIFDAEEGEAASAAGSQPMTRLVAVIDTVSVPPYVESAPDLAEAKAQFDSQFVGNLLGMYVGELQSKTDVRFNQLLLDQVLTGGPITLAN
jgi:peptidyl-prolyl cis-trans isomerase D